MQSVEILERLIAFPTVSSEPNRELIHFCAGLLQEAGAEVVLIEAEGGRKANLYATLGPRDRGGVMLSGHTDVVPVEGQDWTLPPFALTEREGRLYGRGTADMKGFVACALAAALKAGELRTPLHLALSHDEEIGCVGVRSLIDMLAGAPVRPRFCIVGEPTSMQVVTGHKGKSALRVRCTGREGHSALAPEALNAIHLACDMIGEIRALQAEVAEAGLKDDGYDVPYTTLHVGRIDGGVALNIVPNACVVDFEIRNLAGDDPEALLGRLRDRAEGIVAPLRDRFPEAAIGIEVTNRYPGLETPEDAEVVAFVKALTGGNGTGKVAFGTEGGLFSEALGVPVVVCGPGSMAQGHKPDEYVSVEQMARCDGMMEALLARLREGV
ncbi:acetylornithine deacetylase [Histidinibacterium lentulum]|uniref:Acetylornithine deacetylase n=1 Tax=Histidinibacterium lentulum TaxID=2480588 RepID=A0A3N2QWE9_9RHOB|nr:acetylornithine deacetylase [Histidinibacterium lentulum]ROT99459.1 acetylornithine deacetylase [Histidinibacterium lentulum]